MEKSKTKRRNSSHKKKKVIIIGGGFAGLNAAKVLSGNKLVDVLLIDKRNHHLFQPLLYQVATAGLNPSDIAAPIRAQFSDIKNVSVHWGCVQSINLQKKSLKASDADGRPNSSIEINYDYLIVACGARHSYFGHPEWETFAPGLKTLEQAIEMRRRFLSALERAENELDPVKQKALLTFIVIGAGPTGVELAGAIADISKTVIKRDFRQFDPRCAQIILIEAGPRILSNFDQSLSKKAENDLIKLGVDVRLQTRVENITSAGVVANGQLIPSECIFWAAGVEATKIETSPVQNLDKAGRVLVSSDLSLVSFPEAFFIGDMASVKLKDGSIVPGLAPAAIQQGKHAAKNILASIKGEKSRPFKYFDKGIMATVGKHKAIMQVGPIKMSGSLAWFSWLFVHILYLIGFKNRVAVVAQWAWSYIFSKRGARLITTHQWKNEE